MHPLNFYFHLTFSSFIETVNDDDNNNWHLKMQQECDWADKLMWILYDVLYGGFFF